MFVECTQNAYHLITGQKVFIQGHQYPAKISKENPNYLIALDEDENWTEISMREATQSFEETEIFKIHFKFKNKKDLKIILQNKLKVHQLV